MIQKMTQDIKQVIVVMAVAVGFLWSAGCSTTSFMGKGTEPTGGSSATTVSTTPKAVNPSPGAQKTTAVYYDFEDVLIPLELEVVQDRSVIVSTPGFTSGILVLKGRVERRSLINFFNNNMQKDNWTILSQIKSPDNSILVYEKAARCAVITIRNERFHTMVEVGVAARVDQDTLLDNSGGGFITPSTSDLTQ